MRLRTRSPTLKRWAILGCPSGTGIWLRDNRKSPAQILVALDWKVRPPASGSCVFAFSPMNKPKGAFTGKTGREISGSIVAPQGFLASGVFCDIKRIGTGKGSEKGKKRDLALIVSQVPATVAGLFTTNQICAAPVKVCLQRVRQGAAQAIVVNSGNANACTGKQGLSDALEMTAVAARELHMPAEHVLVGSTGRIGVNLPMANVKAGILQAVALLDNTPEQARQAAEAILTSDT